ncbi:MAG: hypothetical protein ACJATI_005581 [Halioglobus sp.]|jgi:hypothetical protein
MIVINKILYFLVCIILLSSCFVNKHQDAKCVLDKENNIIKGYDVSVKEFYDEVHFLPRIIEDFLIGGKKPTIEYRDFYKKTLSKNRFAGYHIYGCADTTWAKQTMAYHLIDKYHISRYDSTYYDTVYTISVLDESKLEYSKDSCQQLVLFGSTFNDIVVTDYRCISWGMICHSLMPGMNTSTNSIEGEDRVGYYDIKIPAYIYRDQGLHAYQNYLKNWLGLEIKFERVDTIKIGVYEYRE